MVKYHLIGLLKRVRISSKRSVVGTLGSVMNVVLHIKEKDLDWPWGDLYLHRSGTNTGKVFGIPGYVRYAKKIDVESLGFPISDYRGRIDFERGSVDTSDITGSDISAYINLLNNFTRYFEMWAYLVKNTPSQ